MTNKTEPKTQRAIALKMRELSKGTFGTTENAAIVYLNQVILGKRVLGRQFVDIFIKACECQNMNEVLELYPQVIVDGESVLIEQYVEILVTKNNATLLTDQVHELLSIAKTLKTMGFDLELKITPQ